MASASPSARVDSLPNIGDPPAPAETRQALWRSERGPADRMTGEVMWSALSPSVDPQDGMAFPYQDTRAQLHFWCRGQRPASVGVFFTNVPNLTAFLGEQGYPRMRWDDEIVRLEMTHYARSQMVTFGDDLVAERRIRRHNVLLLELHWHGNGTVYFEFPLGGAARAIDDAREQCRNG